MFDQLLEKLLEEPEYSLNAIYEAKKFWDTPAFKNWFKNSVVVDKNGDPLVVYTGQFNVNVFGEKYDPKRSVAGGLYTTSDPEIASSYAKGKSDSNIYSEGSQYKFKGKNGKYNKKMDQIELSDRQLQILQQMKTEQDEDGGYIYSIGEMDKWIERHRKHDKIAYHMSLTRGSDNLVNIYKFYDMMGYTLSGQDLVHGDKTHFDVYKKNEFEELLDKLRIDWDSADRPRPGVLPLYLSIQKPLVTSEPFPEDLLVALKKKARYERATNYQGSQWSSEVPLKGWIEEIESGDDYWATKVPKKALPIIKQFGYDGIVDTGGKGGGDKHTVYVVFGPAQAKSVFNKGTFSTTSPKVMESKTDVTETPEFKNWFGSSYVLDKKGKPLVVYHHGQFDSSENGIPIIEEGGMHFGTKDAAQQRAYGKIADDLMTEIDIFEEDGGWHWEMGSFSSFDFTPEGFGSKEDAKQDAEETAMQVSENEVSDAEELGKFTAAYLKIENPKYMKDQAASWSKAVKTAKAEGHDGIIYMNEYEDHGSESYIVFDPVQIKSVDNRGTFDPNSDDIMETLLSER